METKRIGNPMLNNIPITIPIGSGSRAAALPNSQPSSSAMPPANRRMNKVLRRDCCINGSCSIVI